MRFAVGYQLSEDADDTPFREIVDEFRSHIEEVYFSWPALPSGRAPMAIRNGFVDWSAQSRLEADLAAFNGVIDGAGNLGGIRTGNEGRFSAGYVFLANV